MRSTSRLAMGFVSITLFAGSIAVAETTDCSVIRSVPHTIDRSGVYCLARDLRSGSTSGIAITVNADDVVLDLNGHVLDGLPAGTATEAVGIASFARRNITVRNGIVRGFWVGIALDCELGIPMCSPVNPSQGHVVEDIRADRNTLSGISVWGHGTIVRNNLVVKTGGTTAIPNASAYGIRINGFGNRVIDNDVHGVTAQGTGESRGILFFNATDALVMGNRITDAQIGIDLASTTGQYRDNITSGVAIPYSGTGTNAGNNH
jgi:hypothetical protein